MTRGVLIDVAALKGVDMLPDAYEITVQDLQQALAKQNLPLQPGDAVLIHTGWGRLWERDNAGYARGNPGIGVAAGEWLARHSLCRRRRWPYSNSSAKSTHLNSSTCAFFSGRRGSGILIFHGRVNTFGSSRVVSYMRRFGPAGV